MVNPLKGIVINIINLFHKPNISNDILLKLLYFELFFKNGTIMLSIVYTVISGGFDCGRLSFLLGRKNLMISQFGNIGIEINEDFRGKGIGIICIRYSINQLITYFGSCILTCSSNNVIILSLLDKLNMHICKTNVTKRFCVYEYRRSKTN
jgi:hypothetical protein|tara:strand:- start:210 stop:662 length:453 start_codon:yes stop_codon:yes gene_type:complete